ncbi:hypothetical protein B0H13DRAFT_1853178 [Mycena leptocephala]|nr:hypothetical protein B0H13DRAFT_1853178 [Mycena leptocephala]
MSPAHQLLLALVFLTSSCGALPVTITHSAAPSVAACFAVLALLLLFVFVKRVYIRKSRRMIQARQNSILTHSVPRHKKKTGFFVGFFGDPTVEIQSALEKGEWTENKQSSFTYRIHTESRPYGREYPSVLDIRSRFRNRSVSTSPCTPDILPESHSLKLPSFPDKAQVNSSARRFSLPTMRLSVADPKGRRHSSVRSARSRRSVTFAPGSSSSHRIIDSSSGRNASLPLSPQLSEVSATSPNPSSVSGSGPFSPEFRSRLSHSFIPPLPPLPFTHSPPSNTECTLSAHHRKNVRLTPPLQTDLIQQFDQHIQSERASGQALSFTLPSFPPPPPVAGILKPKLRVRTESLNTELSSYAHVRFNQSPGSLGSSSSALRVSDVGSNSETHLGVKRRLSSVSSCHTSKIDDNDPNVLLGIIREPVEQTSQWDQSTISMNQSLKKALQDSGFTPSKSAGEGFSDTPVSNGECDSESVEVERQLLGLDISKSESFYDVGTSKSEDATNRVSFWDEDSGERYEFYFKSIFIRVSSAVQE